MNVEATAHLLCVSPFIVDAFATHKKADLGKPGVARVVWPDAVVYVASVNHRLCDGEPCERCHDMHDAMDSIKVAVYLERLAVWRCTSVGLVERGRDDLFREDKDENGPYLELCRPARTRYLDFDQVEEIRKLLGALKSPLRAMVRRAAAHGAETPRATMDWILESGNVSGWAEVRDDAGRLALRDACGQVHSRDTIDRACRRTRVGGTSKP